MAIPVFVSRTVLKELAKQLPEDASPYTFASSGFGCVVGRGALVRLEYNE